MNEKNMSYSKVQNIRQKDRQTEFYIEKDGKTDHINFVDIFYQLKLKRCCEFNISYFSHF